MPTTSARIASLPYLNSAPFYRGLPAGDRFEIVSCVPRELGELASRGEIMAGLLPLADYLKLQDRFERLGPFGIAVRGLAHSVILFSRKPVRQLDGAVIAVTEETSTSAVLLRLILERRYHVSPSSYRRGDSPEADALLLIGDAALRLRAENRRFPYEIDVAFEWWLWQHLPFVFAVWAIRKDAAADEKRDVERLLIKTLAMNQHQHEALAQEFAASLGLPAGELQAYLAGFIYRLGQPEEAAITRFAACCHDAHLL